MCNVRLWFGVAACASLLFLGPWGCPTSSTGSPRAATRQSAAPAPPVVAKAPDSTNLATPDPLVLPPGAAKPSAPFPGDGWEEMFDGHSWAGWKETPFAGRGETRVGKGVILLGMGDPFTGINWTNPFPTVNYEIAFDAMRVLGTDFFCGFTFPVKASHCSLILGGWGGSLVGISSINGMDASENETTKYSAFDTGRWYRVRLRVTDQRIEVWLDEDKVINLVTTGRQLKCRAGEIESSIPLGLASWQTSGALREIKWRKVTAPADPPPKEF